METLKRDLIYALRNLSRSPGFALIAGLTLALGIGANTTIFSLIHGALIEPSALRHVKDTDRLVVVWGENKPRSLTDEGSSAADFADWKREARSFERLAAFRPGTARHLTGAGEPERVAELGVSADFFPLFGVKPRLGRAFLPEEMRPGGPRVVVLGEGLWRRRFGADPAVVGKTILLDGESATIVGVLTPNLAFLDFFNGVDLWAPLVPEVEGADRDDRALWVLGLLRPGATVAQARAEVQGISRRLAAAYPITNAGWSVDLIALKEELLNDGTDLLVLFMLATVGFVLLIACANVASLMLARGAARQGEIAVRAALGAGRARLLRLLLTESLLIGLVGGVLALLAARWGIDFLRSVLPAGIADEARLDGSVLLFTLAASLLSVLLFGALPALQLSSPRMNEAFRRGGGRTHGSVRGHRTYAVLVAGQVGLAMVALVGAGLMLRSFQNLQRLDLGFDPRQVLTLQVSLFESRYPEPRQAGDYYRDVLERIAALSGTRAAAAVSPLPVLGGEPTTQLRIQGRATGPREQEPWASPVVVTPDYFRALGIAVRSGRGFSDRDVPGAPLRAVVSERAASLYWGGEDAIGARIRLASLEAGEPEAPEWLTVVGVVSDIRPNDIDGARVPIVYVPLAQHPQHDMSILVRTAGDPLRAAPAVRRAIWSVDPDQPLHDVRTIEQVLYEDLRNVRSLPEMLGLFAAVGLLLSAAGIYGVVSHSVASRTQELGVRVALGARAADVLRLVVRRGMTPVLIGLACGVVTSLALMRLISSLLYRVSPADPTTFALVGLVLGAVGLLASYVPARRATAVSPIVALRAE